LKDSITGGIKRSKARTGPSPNAFPTINAPMPIRTPFHGLGKSTVCVPSLLVAIHAAINHTMGKNCQRTNGGKK
jgi:hypothetical protein